ncbi:hypothetical protein FACS1894172_00900 [Spirochaetia bacterium]|nr:hypothetical protein FACS1894164_17680 [Spirochaetia bacterium]GHU29541.1 hypothetical protein FACS1894172_00900 [Spirochaetia bacterium]
MKIRLCAVLLISVSVYVFSQEPFLIPQNVFVGDRAKLMIPSENVQKWEQTMDLPRSPELHIHRISGEKGYIVIDFTAFSPEIVEIPPIPLPNGTILTGLTVSISSILNDDSMLLSGPSAPLLIPGTQTFFLILTVFILILCIVAVSNTTQGKHFFYKIGKQLQQRWFLHKLKRITAELYNTGYTDQKSLDRLSTELRNFLTLWTGIDCRVLSAEEFISVETDQELFGTMVSGIFNHCDEIRFGGLPVEPEKLHTMINSVQDLVDKIEKNTFRFE